jgi:hypothetical protein
MRPTTRWDPRTIKSLHVVMADIEQARADLVGRGVEVRAIEDVGEESSTHGWATPTATL